MDGRVQFPLRSKAQASRDGTESIMSPVENVLDSSSRASNWETMLLRRDIATIESVSPGKMKAFRYMGQEARS